MAAAAGLHSVRILKREAPLFQAVVEINRSTVQVQIALLIHNDGDAMLLRPGVLGLVKLFVKLQRLVKSAASACRNPDSQKKRLGVELLILEHLFYFDGSPFGQHDTHRSLNSLF